MVGTNTQILTINAGSSSIKLDLFLVSDSTNQLERVLRASIEGIGQTNTVFSVHGSSENTETIDLGMTDQATAVETLMHWLNEAVSAQSLAAVGHRIVHGGPRHTEPALIDDKLEADLQSFANFDPEHTPAALQLICVLREQYPNIPHVACFDTAFFHDLPRVAQLLGLPRKYEAEGLRRYGFHGLSYTALLAAFRAVAGEDAANGRIIFAHLGSGASLAATHRGQPVDTTMSFTPASGVVMSSRSGDLDPGIAGYMYQQHGMTPAEFTHLVNYESGLLGVSELSADMYTLLQHESTNPNVAEAIDLFIYQTRKAIGALAATLGGLDSVIFSGGIGERSAVIRARVCDGLGFLGIELDSASNEQSTELISSAQSRVGVHVITTDEASIIAKQVFETIDTNQNEGEK